MSNSLNPFKKPFSIAIMGPTASGKTQLAFELCKQLPCEIINVDSAQIYKGMDIGTAKPTLVERETFTHHLIDFLDPAQAYNVSQFCHDALEAINIITTKNKIPILVGGTMMYFKGLLFGLNNLPESDKSIRQEIETYVLNNGLTSLYEKLTKVDPATAKKLSVTDSQRIKRAMEVYTITGKPISILQQNSKNQHELPQNILNIAIVPDRKLLHHNIEQRFYQMIEQGFIDEVKKLYARLDLSLNLPSMRCVGYRQIWEWLDGKYSYNEMIYKAICASRQLAKRQCTWLKQWPNLHQICENSNPVADINQLIQKQINIWETKL